MATTFRHYSYTVTALPFLLLLPLLSSAAPGPSVVPLHDIIGKNLTSSNLYYIRNYTVGSYSGTGLTLYALRRCAKFVGFTASSSDTGLPVRLTPGNPNATVIYPGDRFKLTLASPPPCSRDPEIGIQKCRQDTCVVTRGVRASESYFSVAVDELGRYSLQFCGPCALCRNLCTEVQAGSAAGWLRTGGRPFNFFFQKKVKGSFEFFQSQ